MVAPYYGNGRHGYDATSEATVMRDHLLGLLTRMQYRIELIAVLEEGEARARHTTILNAEERIQRALVQALEEVDGAAGDGAGGGVPPEGPAGGEREGDQGAGDERAEVDEAEPGDGGGGR